MEEDEFGDRAHSGPPFVSAFLLLASGALVAMGAFFTFQWSQSDNLAPAGLLGLGEIALSPQRIAVLPFADLDGTEAGNIFANGIHEDILNHLAKIDSLEIISRTTVMLYRDTEKSIQEIGRELGAGSILEGSVRRQGNQLRVVAQLIDSRTEAHLWSETFDAMDTDVFEVQSRIAREIAGALEVELTTEELAELEAASVVNGEAYAKYTEGLAEWDLRENRANASQAVAYFQEATEIDPNFATAYAYLSQARMWIFWNFPGAQDQAELATEALERALALAPNAVETHLAQGYFYFYGQGDSQEALRHFYAAESIKPSDADVHTAIGLILRGQGRWEEALDAFHRARTYDRRSYNLIYTLGETYMRMRRWDEAAQYLEQARVWAPDVVTAYRDLLKVRLASTGDTVVAREYIDDLPETTPRVVRGLLESELAYYRGDLQAAMGRQETRPGATDGRPASATRRPLAAEPVSDLGGGRFDPADGLPDAQRGGMGFRYERQALLYHLRGEYALRDAYADSLRISSQETLNAAAGARGAVQTGVIARAKAKLGLAYALLGESIHAAREGSTAVSSLSIADDAFTGAEHLRDLVLIYTLIGATDLAMQELQTALSVPSPLTRTELLLDPLFEPLREHAGFQDLLALVR